MLLKNTSVVLQFYICTSFHLVYFYISIAAFAYEYSAVI